MRCLSRESATINGGGGTTTNGSEQRELRPAARVAALAALLIALLLVVALGSRGAHPGGHGRLAQRTVPNRVSDDLWTALFILYALALVLLAAAFMLSRRKWEPVHRHWLRQFVVLMALLTIAAVVGYRIVHSRAVQRKAAEQARNSQTGGAGGQYAKLRGLKRATSGGARFDWTLASGLIGLLVVGGAIYYVRNRKPLPPELALDDEAVAAELALVLSDAVEDLRNEPDPRRAVIASYARMEGVLARRGQPRRPAETPFEFLGRMLRTLDVPPDAVQELTALFELAKFSRQPIDVDAKERAIEAFTIVRDELRRPVRA